MENLDWSRTKTQGPLLTPHRSNSNMTKTTPRLRSGGQTANAEGGEITLELTNWNATLIQKTTKTSPLLNTKLHIRKQTNQSYRKNPCQKQDPRHQEKLDCRSRSAVGPPCLIPSHNANPPPTEKSLPRQVSLWSLIEKACISPRRLPQTNSVYKMCPTVDSTHYFIYLYDNNLNEWKWIIYDGNWGNYSKLMVNFHSGCKSITKQIHLFITITIIITFVNQTHSNPLSLNSSQFIKWENVGYLVVLKK